MYSDMLHIRLCRLCDVVPPLVSAPPHMLPLCLFICLFILVPWCHVLLALFVYFPFWIVSVVDRQWADTKSDCTHCIRRGLSRRLRSSLLLLGVTHLVRYCQGVSETGNISCPSAHGTLMDLRNRCSRGWVPAECLEQKMLYVYATVCTQGDFTLSRK